MMSSCLLVYVMLGDVWLFDEWWLMWMGLFSGVFLVLKICVMMLKWFLWGFC